MTKITDAGLYLDPKAINSIKENTNKAEGLEQAADQFETLFLQMVLKSMRDASDALSDEDTLVSSKQERMYRDMYDGQLATAMINKGSLGIADAMVKQLSSQDNAGEINPVAAGKENKNDNALKSGTNTVANQEVSNDAFRQPLITMNKINKSGA
ncbi:rod-binding protein [Thalassomonas viridans]|uniref:Rod-binding protein n=1 Tax=Thalassomonas viridans TaxID=137584 RepID=A0AAE9Z247_9GAMM|nr:rod-binding protein [Thalassomonas viridans]WDE05178.1 rod-binding protein [Thalassomonas viridans]